MAGAALVVETAVLRRRGFTTSLTKLPGIVAKQFEASVHAVESNMLKRSAVDKVTFTMSVGNEVV